MFRHRQRLIQHPCAAPNAPSRSTSDTRRLNALQVPRTLPRRHGSHRSTSTRHPFVPESAPRRTTHEPMAPRRPTTEREKQFEKMVFRCSGTVSAQRHDCPRTATHACHSDDDRKASPTTTVNDFDRNGTAPACWPAQSVSICGFFLHVLHSRCHDLRTTPTSKAVSTCSCVNFVPFALATGALRAPSTRSANRSPDVCCFRVEVSHTDQYGSRVKNR